MASTEDGIKALCALLAAHLEAETAETVFETYVGELLNLYKDISVKRPIDFGVLAGLTPEVKKHVLEHLESSIKAEELIAMRATAQDPVHKLAQCLIDAIPTSSGSLDDPNVLGALKHTIQQLPAKYYPERLLQTSNLSEKQLQMVQEINAMMEAEYSVRRKMQLQRLDVTVDSFGWHEQLAKDAAAAAAAASASAASASAASNSGDAMDVSPASPAVLTRAQRMQAKYNRFRGGLLDYVKFDLYDVACARTDLAHDNEKPVSQTRVATNVRDFMLGSVPDRGGRVTAAAKKAGSSGDAPATPSSSSSSTTSSSSPSSSNRGGGRGGRGGRGRGGHGGGRGGSSGAGSAGVAANASAAAAAPTESPNKKAKLSDQF